MSSENRKDQSLCKPSIVSVSLSIITKPVLNYVQTEKTKYLKDFIKLCKISMKY